MTGIFISYRRGDTAGSAGRLYEDLQRRFPGLQIFFDVDGIVPGQDFRTAIDRNVSTCAALLAIIGPDWIKVQDATGRRRIDDPADFVRLEIATALARDIIVIPVRVEGAPMPEAKQLPE